MATTDLNLDDPGTLPKPGQVGRIVRIAFGALSLSYVLGLVEVHGSLLTAAGNVRPVVWNGIVPGLLLISYVINIGFSRAWRKLPALASGALFLIVGGIGLLVVGTLETQGLALTMWTWEVYLFTHLGLAFIVAGLIGTPGCEMRAFHDLYSRAPGKPTKEHYCPVGPLNSIDRWEASR